MNVKASQRRKFSRKFQERFRFSDKSFLKTDSLSKNFRFDPLRSRKNSKNWDCFRRKIGTERYSLQLALFDIGWAHTLGQAKKVILSGKVLVNGSTVRNSKKNLNCLDTICYRFSDRPSIKVRQYQDKTTTYFLTDSLTLTAIFVGELDIIKTDKK